MLQLSKILLFIFSFTIVSCNDKGYTTDDNNIDLLLEVTGELAFPKEGGRISLSIKTYAVKDRRQGSSEKSIISPCLIDFNLENDNFAIINSKINSDYLIIEVEAKENKEISLINDKLTLSTQFNKVVLEKQIDLSQAEAVITYKRIIAFEGESPIVIPPRGGTFEIPFISKKEIYINGQYSETLASDLIGLYLEHIEINCSGVHWLSYSKDDYDKGSYFFIYKAGGPYNLNFEWDGVSEEGLIPTKSYLLIKDKDTELLRIDFIQPQTPGEDYFYGMSSFYSKEPFNI